MTRTVHVHIHDSRRVTKDAEHPALKTRLDRWMSLEKAGKTQEAARAKAAYLQLKRHGHDSLRSVQDNEKSQAASAYERAKSGFRMGQVSAENLDKAEARWKASLKSKDTSVKAWDDKPEFSSRLEAQTALEKHPEKEKLVVRRAIGGFYLARKSTLKDEQEIYNPLKSKDTSVKARDAKFQKGQRVKVLSGASAGSVGTIETVESDRHGDRGVLYNINFGGGSRVRYWETDLRTADSIKATDPKVSHQNTSEQARRIAEQLKWSLKDAYTPRSPQEKEDLRIKNKNLLAQREISRRKRLAEQLKQSTKDMEKRNKFSTVSTEELKKLVSSSSMSSKYPPKNPDEIREEIAWRAKNPGEQELKWIRFWPFGTGPNRYAVMGMDSHNKIKSVKSFTGPSALADAEAECRRLRQKYNARDAATVKARDEQEIYNPRKHGGILYQSAVENGAKGYTAEFNGSQWAVFGKTKEEAKAILLKKKNLRSA